MRVFSLAAAALGALLCSMSVHAGGVPGQFDYWVLPLSWSPEFCASDFGDDECRESLSFVVRGLIPQKERGRSPIRCDNRERVPKELMLRMQPLMATEKAIQAEWNRYGNCSGLEQQAYFELVERARRKLEIPSVYDAPKQRIESSRDEILQTFRALNPDFKDSIALDCRRHWLRTVQVCFDRELNPRDCGREIEDDCSSTVLLRAPR